MRGLDAKTDTAGIDGVGTDCQSVTGSAADGAVDGLIGLRLNEDQSIVTIGEDVVERVAQLERHLDGVLALGAERAFTSQPQLDLVGAQSLGDVAGAACTPLRELAVFLQGRGEAAVIRAFVEPQTRCDELSEQTVLVQRRLDVLCIVNDLLLGHVVHVGNSVVVMELHAGQTDLGILLHFLFQGDALAVTRTKGLVALVNVPRTGGKAECSHNHYLFHFIRRVYGVRSGVTDKVVTLPVFLVSLCRKNSLFSRGNLPLTNDNLAVFCFLIHFIIFVPASCAYCIKNPGVQTPGSGGA